MKRKKRLTKRQRRTAQGQPAYPRGWYVDEPNAFVAAVRAELEAHYAGALAAIKASTP